MEILLMIAALKQRAVVWPRAVIHKESSPSLKTSARKLLVEEKLLFCRVHLVLRGNCEQQRGAIRSGAGDGRRLTSPTGAAEAEVRCASLRQLSGHHMTFCRFTSGKPNSAPPLGTVAAQRGAARLRSAGEL